MMKKILVILLISLCFNISFAAFKWVDRIAVVVNNDVITEKDVSDIMSNLRMQLPKKGMTKEKLRELALNKLVEEKLLIQFADLKGIKVSEKEINKALVTIAKANRLSVDALYKRLAREGVDRASLRKTIANNLIVQKVVDASIQGSDVSIEEVNQVLQENKVPINEKNQQQALQLIKMKKSEAAVQELVNSLKQTAYIKVYQKPY